MERMRKENVLTTGSVRDPLPGPLREWLADLCSGVLSTSFLSEIRSDTRKVNVGCVRVNGEGRQE